MRLAVISDIHGNYKALEAFLEYIEEHSVDGIICLGDYLTDSPYPQRTMRLLYAMQNKYPCYMIRGNREQYLLDNAKEDAGWKRFSSAGGMLYYTAQNITEQDLTYFASLPEERELILGGYPPFYICHGTPGKLRGNVTFEEGLLDTALHEITQKYLLGGHSHHQKIYEAFGKTYVNPGSLGVSMDGVGGRASFAMLTAAPTDNCEAFEWRAELLTIPYDVDKYLKDFSESGLDEYGMVLTRALKKSLVTGINYFYMSVEMATKEGNCAVNKVPEAIWDRVADKLGL